jgi:hypothetical protein
MPPAGRSGRIILNGLESQQKTTPITELTVIGVFESDRSASSNQYIQINAC